MARFDPVDPRVRLETSSVTDETMKEYSRPVTAA
jgi:hypothetical protein